MKKKKQKVKTQFVPVVEQLKRILEASNKIPNGYHSKCCPTCLGSGKILAKKQQTEPNQLSLFNEEET